MEGQAFGRRWEDQDDGRGALTGGDWRAPGAAGPPAGIPERRARATDPLHTRARRATLSEERGRARELVDAARGAVTATFEDIRFGRRIDVTTLAPVVSGIAASIARHPTALPSVTRLKTAHEYTYLHSVAVCGLMIGLAGELGLDPELTREIGLAGLLHDIGKAQVPVELLDKPGPLDFAEYAIVQQHTRRGADLLRASGIEAPIALDVCLHHHERIDGAGYPEQLAGTAVSVHARMGAVCDVYDAVTSARAYKARWSPGEALDWMGATTGQFDPRLLQAFRRMIGIFPIGSLVRLESNRLALVIDEGAEDPTAPDVCLVLCAATRRPLAGTRTSTASDRIVAIERAAGWPLGDWDQRRAAMLAEAGVA